MTQRSGMAGIVSPGFLNVMQLYYTASVPGMQELEMVCTCRAEGVQEAEARRLRIHDRMKPRHMDDLTTAITLSLAFDFQAEADFDVDMWFGVTVCSPLGDIFIQCDNPGDGLAAAWEHLANAHPERVSQGPGTEAGRQVAERTSAAILTWYLEAEKAYRGHREAAHRDDNDCPPCVDCSVGMNLSSAAHVALDNVWGSRDLEPAVDLAFDRRWG